MRKMLRIFLNDIMSALLLSCFLNGWKIRKNPFLEEDQGSPLNLHHSRDYMRTTPSCDQGAYSQLGNRVTYGSAWGPSGLEPRASAGIACGPVLCSISLEPQPPFSWLIGVTSRKCVGARQCSKCINLNLTLVSTLTLESLQPLF